MLRPAVVLVLVLGLTACADPAAQVDVGDPTPVASASPEQDGGATQAPDESAPPTNPDGDVAPPVTVTASEGETASSEPFTGPYVGFSDDAVGDGLAAVWVAEATLPPGADGGPPASCPPFPLVRGEEADDPDPDARPTPGGVCNLLTTIDTTPSSGRGAGFGIDLPPGELRLWLVVGPGVSSVTFTLLGCEDAIAALDVPPGDELGGPTLDDC